MSLGGIGVISVLSNICPYKMHKMCADFLSGNIKDAMDYQIKSTGLVKALFSDVNPIPVKEAMNIIGLNAGPCRLPLVPMSNSARDNLISKLKELDLV